MAKTNKQKLLNNPDHHPKLKDKATFEKELARAQTRLLAVQQSYLDKGLRGLVLLEGWDCAGKGGIIRRLTTKLDPRAFRVWPISAPSAAEKGEHYLQRFWRRIPEAGTISIFDRSWYGRVLVEPVEGLTAPKVVARAYGEINDFEKMLLADGIRLVKLFIHITPDEQLKRFKERLDDPYKRWKLTADDLRNHEKWDRYLPYIAKMFEQTSTKRAPWTIVNANYKWFGRVTALNEIADRLGRGIDLSPPKISEALAKQIEDLVAAQA
ncbi:Polyphosphate kinase 2, PPK2 family [Arboricoccus pini]|uniref:Polyphosphate kinase 2, PPK2 family n=1 Tax=Arboricoccus pini TaxID=1963835 RepID=A0A212S2F8_9PROT|nr:polyphosphate kinase [Arboricoccus pini]SNB79150.1 Polyphosphate kinase 2, PPK2 family [Arboricoccus pini]